MPRPLLRSAAVAAFVLLLAGLTACSSVGGPDQGTTCSGKIKEVLLGDESATTVVAFDAGDSPKMFGLPSTPVPTCAYKTTTTQQLAQSQETVTHRTYVYVGISDGDAKTVIGALAAAAGQPHWTSSFTNTPAPSTSPAPYALQTQEWDYNVDGSAGTGRASLAYAYNSPVNPGVATQVGLTGSPNVLRVETETTSPK